MSPAAIQLRGRERLIPEEFDRRAFAGMMGRLDVLQAEVDDLDEISEPCS